MNYPAFMEHGSEVLAGLRDDDVTIVSYPRSGNTWVRLLVADVLLQRAGYATDTELPIHADHIIPNLHEDDREPAPGLQLPFRIYKSHSDGLLRGRKAIYVYRDPADTLVSYYHYHLRYDYLEQNAQCGIDSFCMANAPDYARHLVAAVREKVGSPGNIHIVSYENLHWEPVERLTAIFEYLQIPVLDEWVRRSVENHTFGKHLGTDAPGANNERFFRFGGPGSGVRELSPGVHSLLRRKLGTIYDSVAKLAQTTAV